MCRLFQMYPCAPEAVMSLFSPDYCKNLSAYLCVYLLGWLCRWRSQGWRTLPTGFRFGVRLARIESVCCALFIWSMSSPDFSRGFMCTKLLQWKSLVVTSAFLYPSGISTLTSASQIYSCWMGDARKIKGCCWCLGRHEYFKDPLPQDNSGLQRKLLEMYALSRKEQCRGRFRRKEKRHLAAWEIASIILMGVSSLEKLESWINSLCQGLQQRNW